MLCVTQQDSRPFSLLTHTTTRYVITLIQQRVKEATVVLVDLKGHDSEETKNANKTKPRRRRGQLMAAKPWATAKGKPAPGNNVEGEGAQDGSGQGGNQGGEQNGVRPASLPTCPAVVGTGTSTNCRHSRTRKMRQRRLCARTP